MPKITVHGGASNAADLPGVTPEPAVEPAPEVVPDEAVTVVEGADVADQPEQDTDPAPAEATTKRRRTK